MAPATRDALLTVNASWIAFVHTMFALAAFGTALILGTYLHYHQLVKNEWFSYPQEWFPSVSATIGDRYPERPVFQILIAFTSGPRLFLVFLSYVFQTHFSPQSRFQSKIVSVCGLLRTLACGGWVYVTSSDDHDWHDVMMISYLLLTIPWQLGTIILSPRAVELSGNKYRRRMSCLFFISILPLVYFYVQHKFSRVPGAYTYYALIEWSLILYDIIYDSCTILDFAHFDFILVPTDQNPSDGKDGLMGIASRLSKSGFSTDITKHPLKIEAPSTSGYQARAAQKSSGLLRSCRVATLIAQVYFGCVFWTTLTALGPVIFYFSVWSMGLDGQEVLLFSTLAPMLLCLPLSRQLLLKTLPLIRLLSLLGIGSYMVDRDLFYDDAVLRLQLTAASVAFCTSLHAIQLFQRKGQAEVEQDLMTFSIGLIVSVLIKYANHSLNPMWPIMRMNNGGWNRLGCVLGLLANLQITYSEASNFEDHRRPSEPSDANTSTTPHSLLVCRWRAVLGFGAMIFLIHTLFTDSGTVIAWVWDGYPITGPTSARHGYLTIVAMCIGAFLSWTSTSQVLEDTRWLLVGFISAFGLYSYHGWLGFGSGCLLGIFVMSLLPRYTQALVRSTRDGGWPALGIGFGLSYLVYDLMELAHTFTVAYAFVPGGDVFRERTGVVLAVTMIFIGLGFHQSCAGRPRTFTNPGRRAPRATANTFLGILIVGSILVMWCRTKVKIVEPYHSQSRTFKAGIWTVHFGVDSGMWETQRRIKNIIEEMNLDVVGLLESDLQRIVMGNRDLTQYISEELGMYVDIGPGPNKHTWGAALLSKFPIVNSTHHLLPSPQGELAPAIHATLDMWGTMVEVIVSHNGQEEDALDRELQSTELARIMREAYPKPLVFLGYVVTRPHEPKPGPYRILVEDGKMLDIERSDYDRWCEYILFRGLQRLGYARVTRGSKPAVTDTELQVGLFKVPPSWVVVDPDRDLSGYNRVAPEFVQPAIRFSARVGSPEGFKGHKYHVLREQFGTDVVYYRSGM